MDFFVFFWSAGTQFFKDPVKGLLAVVPALHCYVGHIQICIGKKIHSVVNSDRVDILKKTDF